MNSQATSPEAIEAGRALLAKLAEKTSYELAKERVERIVEEARADSIAELRIESLAFVVGVLKGKLTRAYADLLDFHRRKDA